MTILTPTLHENLGTGKPNGGFPIHVLPAHEPTREGEQPLALTAGCSVAVAPPVVAETQPLKVALIGTAPSSRMLAPFNDPAWKIWACSPGNMNILPRVDAWFELHSNLLWPEHESYGRPFIEYLKQQKCPIYMQDQRDVPHALVFPKDELIAEFGDDFFTSSFAWMMAFAMKCGAVEIALYGIDMASRDEYIQQRPGFYFFRYMAKQRGVKVTAPYESDIMQAPPLYGYVDSTPFGRKIMARRKEVADRIAGMSGERDRLNQNITYLQGAVEDVDYFSQIWSGVSNDMGKLEHENALLRAENEKLRAQAAEVPLMTYAAPVSWPMTMPVSVTISEQPQLSAPIAQFLQKAEDAQPRRKSRKGKSAPTP